MKETKPRHSGCPSCKCGLTELTWSDRGDYVDYEDAEQVASVVVFCALDHEYDRGEGVPWGMDPKEADLLRPIVARHLVAIHPGWRHKTVTMNAEQREAFRHEIIAVLRAARNR